MMLKITHGLPTGQEEAAAALYWQAFGEKLGKLMGPKSRGEAFFSESVNHSSVLAAMEGDQLLGIAAFKAGDKGFSDGGVGQLFRHYGLGALWRLIPLAMLERSAPDGILQMDGICVSAEARGKGVGTALLTALFDHAQAHGFDGVTLDVIDRNPRAKALYEKLGFQATGVEHTSILQPLLGFATATRMIKTLG